MRTRIISGTLIGAVVALTAATAAVPASATTSGTWFYASQGPKLVKVELVGSKLVAGHLLAKSTNSNVLFQPTSAMGSFATGTRGVYSSTSHSYKNALFTWDAAHSKLRMLTTTTHDQVVSAALFNSGKSVAYIDQVAGSNKVVERTSTGGTPSTKYTAPKGTTLTGLAVSHDGRTLYLGMLRSNAARVYWVKAGSSTLHALSTSFAGGMIIGMSLSPAGNTLAYGPGLYPPPKAGIHLVKVATGGVTKNLGYYGNPSTTSWSTNGSTVYNADREASGWSREAVSTGKSSALDYNSTGQYLFPVRA